MPSRSPTSRLPPPPSERHSVLNAKTVRGPSPRRGDDLATGRRTDRRGGLALTLARRALSNRALSRRGASRSIAYTSDRVGAGAAHEHKRHLPDGSRAIARGRARHQRDDEAAASPGGDGSVDTIRARPRKRSAGPTVASPSRRRAAICESYLKPTQQPTTLAARSRRRPPPPLRPNARRRRRGGPRARVPRCPGGRTRS